MKEVKTYKQWQKSEIEDYFDFIKPGDMVDMETIVYFMHVVPPVLRESGYFQYGEFIGEEYNQTTNRKEMVYGTFREVDGRWTYCGKCFYAETEERL